MLHLDLAVRVLVDGQRVDHAHGVALTQPFELGDDLAVELRVAEAENNELNWSDCHASPFSRQCRHARGCAARNCPPSHPHPRRSAARPHRPPWMKRRQSFVLFG